MDLQSSVEGFFRTYEAATRAQDATRVAELYAQSFVFGDPARTMTITREDFAKAIPMRRAFFSEIGLEGTSLAACEVQQLTQGYCLANVRWTMHFRKDEHDVESENKATCILHQVPDAWEIVFQLDHQD